nr:glycosyltransferase family 39 protein [Kibdelosporangium sp. MJ126-NF4]CEL19989.1 putative integral membrane protein [Kibdelosporangium sp. MJ126-NF4]CTQ97213.1 putative integral membrane protein [Kibdelosporangium sp. MJ126-NF4]
MNTDDRPVGRWVPLALIATTVLAGVGYAWDLAGQGYSYAYYSAAAKTMGSGVQEFLFGTYDPVGVLTVDKPPLGVWPQVVSVWIFGLHGWAVLLPQVIAGVVAVPLLAFTVRRFTGSAKTGLLAAVILAVTPVTMVITRDNAPDPWLVLCLVAAAYALSRALTGTAETRWLVLSAALLGCGFLVKMGQALLVAPAFLAAYLVGSSLAWGRRLINGAVAVVTVVVASLWWVVLVDLWPGAKPFIGGSADGSAWDLTVGYNGFGRISGQSAAQGNEANPFYSTPGILRLFSDSLAGQAGWLLPLALLGVVIFFVRPRASRLAVAGWVLFGGWLVVGGLVLSFMTGVWLPYYTSMLVPAIAALSAFTIAMLWRYHQAGNRWLLPSVVAVTAAWAFFVIQRDPGWHGWLRIPVAVAAVVAVVALLLGLRFAVPGLVLGLVALLIAPATWSALAVSGRWVGWATNPAAGPVSAQTVFLPPEERAEYAEYFAGRKSAEIKAKTGTLSDEQSAILKLAQSSTTDIQLAAEGGALQVAPFIIHTDLRVVAMGGFTTDDPAPSVDQLSTWVKDKRVRYVLTDSEKRARSDWVEANCRLIPPTDYFPEAEQKLFDCA